VDFLIVRDDGTVAVLCSILDVYVETAGKDPMGRVVDGRITIRAPWATENVLRDLELQRDVDNDWKVLFWDGASVTNRTVEFAAVAVQCLQYESAQKERAEQE
jgi:hypothetical protein